MKKERKIKFSIVTLVKNSAKYLKNCMESVVNQKGNNLDFELEYIVVFGQSHDRSDEIVELYSNKYPFIKIIREEVSRGISSAMNLGLSNTSGDIIGILHSDDLYENTEVLLTVANYFKAHKDRFWIYSNMKIINENNNIKDSFSSPEFSYTKLKYFNIIPHPTVFMKREIIKALKKEVIFKEKYRFAMDYDLWLRVGKIFPAQKLEYFFTCFRSHPESWSTRHLWSAYFENVMVQLENRNEQDGSFYAFKVISLFFIVSFVQYFKLYKLKRVFRR